MATSTSDYQLSDRYLLTSGDVLLTGIQALARLPIEQLRQDQAAGRRTAAFLSGYPGSPLGGLDQEIARSKALVPELPIVHEPAVNEELGATAVMGSQLAPGREDARYEGVVGFWYGKAPGLDRAGDALRHGVFAGADPKGGAVVIVGDDPACKSSTMPSSSDATLFDLHMPVLYPGTVAECLELGLHAVALSRASGLWSSMKIVTPIADGSGLVRVPVLDREPIRPEVMVDGEVWQCVPSAQFLGPRMLEVEREFREIRLPLATQYGIDNELNRIPVEPADAWIGIVATGFTYYEVLDALRRLGFDGDKAIAEAGIRLLQLRMPVPFDAELARRFATGLQEIVVVEEKNATLEWLIKDALYGGGHQPLVVGKHHEDGRILMQAWGQLDADAIIGGLRERLSPRLADRLVPEQPAIEPRQLIPLRTSRTPFFCSGCPHNWGTKVPDNALVAAGTGCHGMTLLMDPERVGDGIGVTAMGNEGAQWVGMEPFVETDHLFQNFGDGTFFHSAQLALQYCVGTGKNMTFKILYNGTVAMTGGQDSPAAMTVPDLCRVVLAYGVTKVTVTTEDVGRYRGQDLPNGVEVRDRSEIVGVQDELRAMTGVTVLIHDQYCAAELRRDRRRGWASTPARRIVINHRICEGCGDCGDVSNCLSVQPVETPLGRKTTIDQASCNFDYSCVNGDCPAFMSVDATADSDSDGVPDDSGLPGPVADPSTVAGNMVRLRMAGIGGTGVVTAAQILATAAMLDGWEVRGLDQTGLSQKAGPVISDVVLTRSGHRASNLVGDHQADVLIGFDGLVAAANQTIQAVSPTTVVVASTHRTPTGVMISQPDLPYPDSDIRRRLEAASEAEGSRFAEATILSVALTGSAAQANMLLLGIVVQGGHLPVSPSAVERAIDLNGVAVDANRAAFGWGRRWAIDPAEVEQIAARRRGSPATTKMTVPDLPNRLVKRVASLAPTEDLAELVQLLAADLVGYQDQPYAEQFIDAVGVAVCHEQTIDGDSTLLAAAVARSLHKLMAYKDEYEVARLMFLPEATAEAEMLAGPGAGVTRHLFPPMLRAVGWRRKIDFGSRSEPALRVLRAGKRLRGSAIDPFARTELRRQERALPGQFLDAMTEVYRFLDIDNLAAAVAIAELPDNIRGYEELKLRRITEYRAELAAALRAMRTTA